VNFKDFVIALARKVALIHIAHRWFLIEEKDGN
jgi:hypothetical protein